MGDFNTESAVPNNTSANVYHAPPPPPRPHLPHPHPQRDYKSIIQCGVPVPNSDGRLYSKFVEYFDEEVEVFVAEIDPLQHELYRPSLLSKKYGWSTNRVGVIF
jgi:hypothetical protein